jgi:GNAT superfamily N-acetyltransferase
MEPSELLEIFTRQQRIELTYPDLLREVDGSVIRLISPGLDGGFVIYSRLDETSADLAITAQIERFESLSQNFEWKHYDYDTPADLLERLRQRGFEIEEPEALVALDLRRLPEVLAQPVPASVVRVIEPGQIDLIVALEDAVWNDNHAALGEFLKSNLRQFPGLVSLYLSFEGQQLASAAWTFFQADGRGASLYGGATLPQFRGRGHYTRLLAVRAQEARARGVTLLTVDASPMSRPILEKHGFVYLATTTPCNWKVRAAAPGV